jgi:L-threonylcarbamoyladenylate synthase
MTNNWNKVQKAIKEGGVAIIPTDTLYGIVGSAYSKKAVERIYKLKGRDDGKPCIVLISSFHDLNKFNIKLSEENKKFLDNIWPGKVSVVLPCPSTKFKYLHRGTRTIAFRMVGLRNKNIYNLIRSVGPLVAPSVCGGTRNSPPSTLISYKSGKWVTLRQGAIRI